MTADIFKVGHTWYINYMHYGEYIKSDHAENIADAVAQAKTMGCKIVTIYFEEA